jgi:hypothetical protein
MDNRTVRIAYTNDLATFTQRGKDPNRGFIRVNGRTIVGDIERDVTYGEPLFYTDGINNDVPYEGDSLGW